MGEVGNPSDAAARPEGPERRPIEDYKVREVVRKDDVPQQLRALDDAKLRDVNQDIDLKNLLAKAALAVMAVQLLFTHIAFYMYGMSRVWRIPDGVMIVYLTENFAQVVGIVFVITRYLFPSRRG